MTIRKWTAITMFSARSRAAEPITRRQNARWLVTAGITAGLLISGCGKKQSGQTAPAASNASAAPAASNASAGPAAAASPVAQSPTAQNTNAPNQPASSANSTNNSAAPPPPSAPQLYTVPRGARVEFRLTQTLRAKDSNVGDGFRGVLARSIRVGGVTVLRAGAPVSGTVVAAKGQGRFKGSGTLAIDVDRVDGHAVRTTAYERKVKGKGKRSAGFIGGGGGGGALIGALAGGGKGALIGGLVGAGAGTAGAALTGNDAVTIPAESIVSVSLAAPLDVAAAPAAPPQ